MNEIKIQQLNFAYQEGQDIFHNLNLVFNQQTTAIIGQNGAGKTTLVKLIKGLLKPDSGDILVNGKNTREFTAAQLAKYVGLVFQNPADQIFKHKVIDEILFGPKNIGQSDQEANENAHRAMELLEINEYKDENPYDLSLPLQKQVAIASVIAMNTPIIIFDEPTMGQDYLGKERLKKVIKTLQDEGKLVLTIIHDMDFVAETFERTVVLNQGKVVLDGSTREVFSNEAIINNAYLELPHVTQLAKKLGFQETFLTVDELIAYKKVQNT